MTARSPADPTLELERRLLASGCARLGALDEVGRGSLAGPVCVGIVVIEAATGEAPQGVRDSKLLSVKRREALIEPIRRWALTTAVGHASNVEIDTHGIVPALRLAGLRAIASVARDGFAPDGILLDGSHDWLSGSSQAMDTEDAHALAQVRVPRVRTLVKADMTCAAVAAASVLAKVERDARMVELDEQFPQYGWNGNKGYASPGHIQGLREHGASPWHRMTWSLPGLEASTS